MNTDGRLSIGTLSQAAGVKVVTIRYYEGIKLMPVPPRTEGNYRAYRKEHLHRLRFIRRCRDLGFTLDQIRELLRLSVHGKHDCADVDRLTARHLEEIERKIAESNVSAQGIELLTIAAFSKHYCPATSMPNDSAFTARRQGPIRKNGNRIRTRTVKMNPPS